MTANGGMFADVAVAKRCREAAGHSLVTRASTNGRSGRSLPTCDKWYGSETMASACSVELTQRAGRAARGQGPTVCGAGGGGMATMVAGRLTTSCPLWKAGESVD